MGFVISGMELLIIGILWEFLIIIAVLLVVLIIVIARKSFGSKAPEPAQEKLEHNQEMKGKTLEEYKKYYQAKKKKLDLTVERKESESNFCENCGKSLKPEAKFCGSCGNQV